MGQGVSSATIPSKALRHAIQRLVDVQVDHLDLRIELTKSWKFKDMMRTASSVVSRIREMGELCGYRAPTS